MDLGTTDELEGDLSSWLAASKAQPPEVGRVIVDGAGIETLAWGERGKPGLLLLPGMTANAWWWSFIAPHLAADHRVVSLSWSGMGHSDWRERYDADTYVNEVLGVAQSQGFWSGPAKPIMIGHSFGGAVAVLAAAHLGERFGGCIVVDTTVLSSGTTQPDRGGEARQHRVYSTRGEAIDRFRLLPSLEVRNRELIRHIGGHSLKEVGGGWTWSFDPDIRAKRHWGPIRDLLPKVGCPAAFLRGSRSSLLTAEEFATMSQHASAESVFMEIADSDHHVLVDQPLALIDTILELLAAWERSP